MNTLTKEQIKAIRHAHGPACVIAGAGTGKTTALLERMFYLLSKYNFKPERILVTTFTRKATAELYHKASERLSHENAQHLKILTTDSLIWDMAKRAMHRGSMPYARLIGEAEQQVLLLQSAWETFGRKSVLSRSQWTESADAAGIIGLLEDYMLVQMAHGQHKQDVITSVRNRLDEIQPDSYSYPNWIRRRLHFAFKSPNFQDLKKTVANYFKKLKKLGATDYDLLSKEFLQCLKRHKKLTKELASEFDAILVDEFHDTDQIQVETLLLLSGKKRNIWVVGDPCQQIYEWRGAWPENILEFIKKTKAKKYHLTENWRSTQTILNCAYRFLSYRIPKLKRKGMLKPLKAMLNHKSNNSASPVFTGNLEQSFSMIRQLLGLNPGLKPCDVAILSRQLNKRTIAEIEKKAESVGLKVQFQSSRADHAMEQTIGNPPAWKPGTVLKNLYRHPKIKNLVSRSMRKKDFTYMRTVRSLATSADALDKTLPSRAFTFKEAWPALKKTQDREISVTPAVVNRPDAIQAMTIHAAKGLEFPIVLLMKLGAGGPRSFPEIENKEDARLAYVGVTRAKNILCLVHTQKKPKKTLFAFGRRLVPVHRDRKVPVNLKITAQSTLPPHR